MPTHPRMIGLPSAALGCLVATIDLTYHRFPAMRPRERVRGRDGGCPACDRPSTPSWVARPRRRNREASWCRSGRSCSRASATGQLFLLPWESNDEASTGLWSLEADLTTMSDDDLPGDG